MAELVLSDEEKYYIVLGVAQNVRSDGRSRLDYRSKDMEAHVVSSAHGSVRFRLAETDVIVAVKVESGVPDVDRPDQGKIEFLVDCSPTASPDFEGRGGDQLAEIICRVLSSAYAKSGAINMNDLCIVPGKFCYVVGVDILVLQCGGNLLDVIAMGVKTCLGICEIPIVTGLRYDLGEPMPVFTTDEYQFIYLDVTRAPVIVSLPRVGRDFVIDATLEEESCSKGKLVVAITSDGHITSIEKLGRACYQNKSIVEATQIAGKVAEGLDKVLTARINLIKREKPQAENIKRFVYVPE